MFSLGILDQSAVWVDEMNYYDMRTDRNKGIPPLSLRPANPLGIEIDKWVPNVFNTLFFFFLAFFSIYASVNSRKVLMVYETGRDLKKHACISWWYIWDSEELMSNHVPLHNPYFGSSIKTVDNLKAWYIELQWCLVTRIGK